MQIHHYTGQFYLAENALPAYILLQGNGSWRRMRAEPQAKAFCKTKFVQIGSVCQSLTDGYFPIKTIHIHVNKLIIWSKKNMLYKHIRILFLLSLFVVLTVECNLYNFVQNQTHFFFNKEWCK